MAKKTITITQEQVAAIINDVVKGKIFTIGFNRVAPKCLACDKADKKWASLTHCPKCGAELSLLRFSQAQKGVANPKTAQKPGEGAYKGVSAKEAWQDGVLKYFDGAAINKSGGRGDFRSARLDSIFRIVTDGVEYIVE